VKQDTEGKKTTNSKPIPHIPLPFKEVIADVLKVRPPEKPSQKSRGKASPRSK
jgi:hypothetical protein